MFISTAHAYAPPHLLFSFRFCWSISVHSYPPWPVTVDHSPPSAAILVIFISERSEFELIGNGHAGTAPQNRCGPDQMSGGDAELGVDESGDINVGTGPGNSHWCTKDLKRVYNVHQEARGCTGKFEGG